MIIWTTAKTVEKSRLTAHNPVCEREKKEREGERERTEKKRLGDQVSKKERESVGVCKGESVYVCER